MFNIALKFGKDLNKEYEKAMQYAGGSWSAGFEITKQYKEKLNRINNNCN